jgi:peptide/nickel transport system ATP-binding protein
MSPPLLSIAHLCAVARDDRDTLILRDVSFEVARGEVHGLVGESGAGKSTIAKAILDILPQGIRLSGGTIALEGSDLLTFDAATRRRLLGAGVSLIPQDPLTALNPGRRIEAQLTDGLRMWRGMSAKAARERALQLLDEVQMRDPERVMRAYPHELSGGHSAETDPPAHSRHARAPRYRRRLRHPRSRRGGADLRPRHAALHGQGDGAGRDS